MASRLCVTYEDVARAADMLARKKQSVTLENIRKITGVGSNTTLSKYLREWKENKRSKNPRRNVQYRKGYEDAIHDCIKKLKGFLTEI